MRAMVWNIRNVHNDHAKGLRGVVNRRPFGPFPPLRETPGSSSCLDRVGESCAMQSIESHPWLRLMTGANESNARLRVLGAHHVEVPVDRPIDRAIVRSARYGRTRSDTRADDDAMSKTIRRVWN